KRFPQKHGVYAYVKDDEVVLIGKSENLQRRQRKYVNPNPNGTRQTAKRVQGNVDEAFAEGKEVSVYFMTLDPDNTASRETELIRDLQPSWNVQGIRHPGKE